MDTAAIDEIWDEFVRLNDDFESQVTFAEFLADRIQGSRILHENQTRVGRFLFQNSDRYYLEFRGLWRNSTTYSDVYDHVLGDIQAEELDTNRGSRILSLWSRHHGMDDAGVALENLRAERELLENRLAEVKKMIRKLDTRP